MTKNKNIQFKRVALFICGICLLIGSIFFAESASFASEGICKDQDQPINIGVILPLSTDNSIYGIPNLFGIITALRSHDLVRQDRCKFKLIVYNDEGDPEKAAAAADKLIANKPDVLAILGSANSDATEAILAKTKEAKVVLISGQASKKELRSRWFFRTAIPTDKLVRSMLDYLRQNNLLGKEILILYKDKNAFSEDLKDEFITAINSEFMSSPETKNYTTNPKDPNSIKNVIDWIPPKTEVLIIVNGSDKEAAIILDTLNNKKRNELKDLDNHIFVIELHPAIFDRKLFDNVYMFTSYYPSSDTTRIGTGRFRKNYEHEYDEVIKPCYKENDKCDEINKGRPVEVTFSGNLFNEFEGSVYKPKDANRDYLSNKLPSYAVALGYDQAYILMEAIKEEMHKAKDVNSFINDPDTRKNIRNAIDNIVYTGALGTYVFNDESRNGIAQPEVIFEKPKPWLDSKLPKDDNLKTSLTTNYDRKNGDVHTTSFGISPKISYTVFQNKYWAFEPNVFYKYSSDQQDDQGTRVTTWGANFALITVKYFKDCFEPYVSIFGSGYVHTESSNKPSQRDYTAIFTAGVDIPLSKITKTLSLNIEWAHYDKYRKSGEGSVMSELSVGLKITFPPPK